MLGSPKFVLHFLAASIISSTEEYSVTRPVLTSSGPCRPALPELRELKEKYPETLELISLSVDPENIWRKASEELHLTGNNWNEG